jgi:hypothetical protein
MEIKDDYDPTQIDSIIYRDDIYTNSTPTSNPNPNPNTNDRTGTDNPFGVMLLDELKELNQQSDHSDNDSDRVI